MVDLEFSIIVTISMGAVLILIGVIFMRSHVVTWRRQKNDSSLDDFDRLHYHKRYRRRMQTSSVLILLGVVIPLGDIVFTLWAPLRESPIVFAVFWLSVLSLTVWLIVLAAGDFVATRAHSLVALNRIRHKQKELERKLAELRSHGSNGHPQSRETGVNRK